MVVYRLCASCSDEGLRRVLRSRIYVLDFDGVLVHRFTQFMDWLSARKELARAMIEGGFNVEVISRYLDPYDLIKLCYNELGLHKDFNYLSKVLEAFELNALPKLVIEPTAKKFIETLTSLGKSIYISTLQSSSVIKSFTRMIDLPLKDLVIRARDSGGRPKPYVDQLAELLKLNESIVVIGDSCTDGFLARNLNASFVALDTDGYTYHELCYVGAVAVFDGLNDLLELIIEAHENGIN